MSAVLNETILNNKQLAPGICRMTIESAQISRSAAPGQFVNIKCSDGVNALLRRPISICTVNREAGTLDIVYQIKGTGTELLARKQAGEMVDIIGPLGNPFDLDEKYRKIGVMGGGIGIFPLLYLLEQSKAHEKKAFLGFRNKELVVLQEEFESVSQLQLSTDDGSYGYPGLVTDLVEIALQKKEIDLLYACGPTPMIKKAVALAEQYSVPCQVSMEQRMGCGIGACLVCACKTKAETGDGWEYSHVCKDGPVFWSDQVIFE